MGLLQGRSKKKGQLPAGWLTPNVGTDLGDIELSMRFDKPMEDSTITGSNNIKKNNQPLGDIPGDPMKSKPSITGDSYKQDKAGLLSKNVGSETGDSYKQDKAGILSKNVGQETGYAFVQDAPGVLTPNVGKNTDSLFSQDKAGVLSKNVGSNTGSLFTQDIAGVLSPNVGNDTGSLFSQDDAGVLSKNVGNDTGSLFNQDDAGILSKNVGNDTGSLFVQDDAGILSKNVGNKIDDIDTTVRSVGSIDASGDITGTVAVGSLDDKSDIVNGLIKTDASDIGDISVVGQPEKNIDVPGRLYNDTPAQSKVPDTTAILTGAVPKNDTIMGDIAYTPVAKPTPISDAGSIEQPVNKVVNTPVGVSYDNPENINKNLNKDETIIYTRTINRVGLELGTIGNILQVDNKKTELDGDINTTQVAPSRDSISGSDISGSAPVKSGTGKNLGKLY